MSGEARVISGSLRMREPAELAGRWLLEMDGVRCTVTLTSERVEEANGWRLADPSSCIAAVLPGAAAWRPAPEGVEIAAADRRTLLVFTATGDGPAGEAVLPGGRRATLRPA